MARQLFIALAITAITLAAVIAVIIPSAQSHGDPTCTVRTAQSVAPSTTAPRFAGGSAFATSTVPVQPANPSC